MMISYQIIKSRRKSVCIEIRENGEVIVRCPLRYPEREVEKWVDDFVAGSENFITKKTDLHAKIGELEMEIKWFEHTCQKFIGDDWKEKTEYDKRK